MEQFAEGESTREEIKNKLRQNFNGKIVRKDLTKKIKESKLAEEEKREPELMPPISSHTLRHTGCTRLGENNNVNPKVMQYVMGHSDAQITMNVYNHIAEKSHVENEMSKMNLPENVVKSRHHKISIKN